MKSILMLYKWKSLSKYDAKQKQGDRIVKQLNRVTGNHPRGYIRSISHRSSRKFTQVKERKAYTAYLENVLGAHRSHVCPSNQINRNHRSLASAQEAAVPLFLHKSARSIPFQLRPSNQSDFKIINIHISVASATFKLVICN